VPLLLLKQCLEIHGKSTACKQWHTWEGHSDYLSAVQQGEFVDGYGGQFAVGKFQEDGVAKNFVVEISMMVQPVAAALGPQHGSVSFSGPTILAYGNGVLDLDSVAGFQFVKKCVCVVCGADACRHIICEKSEG